MHRLQIGKVVEVEVGGGLDKGGQLLVELPHKPHMPRGGAALAVAHHPVDRQVKVVEDDRAAKPERRFGRRLEPGQRVGALLRAGRGVLARLGPVLDVVAAGVDVEHLGRKGGEGPVVKDEIFVVEAVLPLIKLGLDAVCQQKQLEDVFYFADRAAAHQRDALGHKARRGREGAFEAALFLQDQGGVDGMVDDVHDSDDAPFGLLRQATRFSCILLYHILPHKSNCPPFAPAGCAAAAGRV